MAVIPDVEANTSLGVFELLRAVSGGIRRTLSEIIKSAVIELKHMERCFWKCF